MSTQPADSIMDAIPRLRRPVAALARTSPMSADILLLPYAAEPADIVIRHMAQMKFVLTPEVTKST